MCSTCRIPDAGLWIPRDAGQRTPWSHRNPMGGVKPNTRRKIMHPLSTHRTNITSWNRRGPMRNRAVSEEGLLPNERERRRQ